MFVATAVVSLVLAAMLILAAVRKLGHSEPVVRSYRRVGVPESRLDQLAAVLLAGAAGLLAGLAWAPVGIAAAIGVICYFLGAIAFHIRARDLRPLPMPILYEFLAVLALALRLVTI